MVARGGGLRWVGKMGEDGQKIQTSIYKINKSSGCMYVEQGDCG